MRVLRIYALATLPALAILGLFTYFANWIPQTRWEPPQKQDIGAAMTPAQLAKVGETIVRERGCLACHTLEPGVGVKGGGRGPNLFGIASRRAQGVPGEPSQVAYLVDSLNEPGEYLVENYADIMPVATRPPARLSYEEVTAVVAYLQSLGGTPSVKVGELPRPVQESGASPPASQPPATEPAGIIAKYGCPACHQVGGQGGTLGPALDEAARLAGKRVPGLAAESYLRQSILEPDAFIVPGAPGGLMPQDFGGRMTAGELETLVQYILSLAGKP